MERQSLLTLIKVMFMLLLLAFLYVLLSTISGPTGVSSPQSLFDDVAIGQTAARRAGQKRVWATRLSSLQRSQYEKLNRVVAAPDVGCRLDKDLCILDASSRMVGIEIVFSEKSPPQLPAEITWFGGFVDPKTGEVFDRFGRVYAATKQDRLELTQVPND